MKIIIKFVIFFAFISISQPIISQTSYIRKDTIYESNINLISGTEYQNARYISMKKHPKEVYIVPIKNDTLYASPGWINITYFPYELESYGLKDGRVYDSKEIEIDNNKMQVFLLRLVDGNVKLYYYFSKLQHSYFFIQKQGSDELILLNDPKSKNEISYKFQLENYLTNCDIYKQVKRKVKYNRESLTKLFQLYNNCDQTYCSYPKYGLSVGFVHSNYVPDTEYDQFLNSIDGFNNNSFAFGVNADFPIKMSRFSFHPELYFNKTDIEYNELSGSNEYTIEISNFSANIPIMLRYTLEKSKVMPYINAGMVYSRNFSNKQEYLIEDHSEDIINDKGQFIDLVSNSRFGIVGGVGVIFKISNTSGLFTELRYTGQGNLGGSSMSNDQLKKREIGLYIGFNL